MKLNFEFICKWQHGRVAITLARLPHVTGQPHQTAPTWPSNKKFQTVQMPRKGISAFTKWLKKLISCQKSISVLCQYDSKPYITHPQEKVKWCAERNEESSISYKRPKLIKHHHSDSTRYSDPINLRLVPMLWSSNGRPPLKGTRTHRTKCTLHANLFVKNITLKQWIVIHV